MKNPNHKHDYSRIDEIVREMGLMNLSSHLRAIASYLCVDFHDLPVGNRKEYVENLSCLIRLNGALQDILVDEYYAQAEKEEEELNANR